MAMLTFNGTAITPDPSDMSVTIQDVSSADSGRSNTTGLMYKFVVAKKRTIDVSWNNIDRSAAESIIQALQSGSSSQYVSVKYDGDPEASGFQTRTFYYGDITSAFQQVWLGTKKRYSKFTLKLIER